jgi:hypothetical protein
MRLAIALILLAMMPGGVHADAASDLSAARDLWHAVAITTYTFVYTDRSDMMIAPPCNWDVLRTHVRNGKPTLSVVLSGMGLAQSAQCCRHPSGETRPGQSKPSSRSWSAK